MDADEEDRRIEGTERRSHERQTEVILQGESQHRQTDRHRQVYVNTPLPELLLGEQFFCLVACRDSFIQGKICLAKVGLGGSEEEEDVEEEELDDLLGPDLVPEEAPALPPGC